MWQAIFEDVVPDGESPLLIATIPIGSLNLTAVANFTIQAHLPVALNREGDSVCLSTAMRYASQPQSASVRRQYAPPMVSQCFQAGPLFGGSANDAAAALSGGEIAAVTISLIVLIGVTAVLAHVVLNRRKRPRSDRRSLAQIELSKIASTSLMSPEPIPPTLRVRKTEEEIQKEKEVLKQKLIDSKVAAAEKTFRHAAGFLKLRYGRALEMTAENMAMVYKLLNLSPRPNLEIIPPLVASVTNFLKQPVTTDIDDAFMDEVVDFIWDAVPDVMLESIIDGYAHLKQQLDQYFTEMNARRESERDRQRDEALENGDLPPVFEDNDEELYEIPAYFLDVVNKLAEGGDEEEPTYAEIEEDLYAEPEAFSALAEDPDYEEMLDQIEEYVEIAQKPGSLFVLEGDYGHYDEDTYANKVAETSFSGGMPAFDDDDYGNANHKHGPDETYGLAQDSDDIYAFAGADDDDDNDTASIGAKSDIYSMADRLEGPANGATPAPADDENYGLNSTLRRDDDTYGLSPDKPGTLRRDDENDTYENSSDMSDGLALGGDNGDDEYENRDDLGGSSVAVGGSADSSEVRPEIDADGEGCTAPEVPPESDSDVAAEGFSRDPMEPPVSLGPSPDGQLEAFRALLDAGPKGEIVYSEQLESDVADGSAIPEYLSLNTNTMASQTPHAEVADAAAAAEDTKATDEVLTLVLPQHDTYAKVQHVKRSRSLRARRPPAPIPEVESLPVTRRESVDDLALGTSPDGGLRIVERRASWAEPDEGCMFTKSAKGPSPTLTRSASRTSMV